MRTLDEILEISAKRKGGEDVIFDGYQPPKSAVDIAAISDDKWLSQMTRCIFQAGFNWKVVDSMWPGFEAAFNNFDVGKCAMMSDEKFDALCKDTSIVRYPQKIRSVQQNAVFLQDIAVSDGGFGKMVSQWPATDFAGLLEKLKKEANRLGGTTGQYFLRSMGVDSYILSKDVVARLIAEGVIDKPPSSKSAMKAVQDAFNDWSAQSGRSLKEVSRILATSLG